MIDTDKVKNELMERGLTPISVPDPENSNRDLIFIEPKVVWDKLFCYLETEIAKELDEEGPVKEFYDSIKHKGWLKKLIIAHNPELGWVNTNKGKALAVMFKPMQTKAGKLPRLDENLTKWFYLVQIVITELLDKLEP